MRSNKATPEAVAKIMAEAAHEKRVVGPDEELFRELGMDSVDLIFGISMIEEEFGLTMGETQWERFFFERQFTGRGISSRDLAEFVCQQQK